jgi:hypothetical protein
MFCSENMHTHVGPLSASEFSTSVVFDMLADDTFRMIKNRSGISENLNDTFHNNGINYILYGDENFLS